jgi:hypothetical protein
MKVTIELTDSELRDILETAGAGCAYWAQTEVRLVESVEHPVQVWERPEGHSAEPVLLGTLTREALQKGAGVFATPGKVRPAIVAQLFDDPNAIDQEAADALVQCALFGEIRYG